MKQVLKLGVLWIICNLVMWYFFDNAGVAINNLFWLTILLLFKTDLVNNML